MDVFAHTLWANAGARKLNQAREKKSKRPLSIAWTSFWGVFPDLFAFGVPLMVALFGVLEGTVALSDFSHHGRPGAFDLAATLYDYSHSLVVWGSVFLGTWVVIKRPPLELLGWALHILLDIPTHRIDFYPTPFLFPLSEYRFPYGISWSDTWFMIVNYTALLLLFIAPIIRKKANKKV